ncbi:MAG: hypothetical protein QM763_08900 [Agriterribacter sp.]
METLSHKAYCNITPRCGLFHFSLESYKYYGALHRYEPCFKLQRSGNICSAIVNEVFPGAAHRGNKNACGEIVNTTTLNFQRSFWYTPVISFLNSQKAETNN